jgi:hypothetical protein
MSTYIGYSLLWKYVRRNRPTAVFGRDWTRFTFTWRAVLPPFAFVIEIHKVSFGTFFHTLILTNKSWFEVKWSRSATALFFWKINFDLEATILFSNLDNKQPPRLVEGASYERNCGESRKHDSYPALFPCRKTGLWKTMRRTLSYREETQRWVSETR